MNAVDNHPVAPTVLQNGLILAAVAAICTALVALTYYATSEQIAANEQAFLEQSLTPVLSDLEFDNNLPSSGVTIAAPHALPGTERAIVYRAFRQGRPVAALFVVTAPDGFTGPIRVLIGVDTNGVITGVRAIEHNETPGLGDLIDISRSNWILQFRGTSLEAPVPAAWSIRRDGGVFDQMTSASVTSRAAVNAISQTLQYFAEHREAIFSAPPGAQLDPESKQEDE